MTYNMFIDDERDPIDVKWGSWQDQLTYKEYDWVIVRDYPEAIEFILTFGMPSVISFDHDLGKNKATGYDICKRLVDLSMNAPDKYGFSKNFKYMVHSKNPVGTENIRCYMDNYLKFLNA